MSKNADEVVTENLNKNEAQTQGQFPTHTKPVTIHRNHTHGMIDQIQP